MNNQNIAKLELVPSAEELKSWYEADLRKAAENHFAKTANQLEKAENAFLSAFRQQENAPETTAKEKYEDNKYFIAYRDYVHKETEIQKRTIEEIENRIEYEWFFLRWERRLSYQQKGFTHYGSNPATRYRADKIHELEKELESLLDNSQEGWEFYYSRQLVRDIATQQEQRLVDVPYVLRARRKITESLELGTPVYLVGHLGSGKTQLATEAALEFTVNNKIQAKLEQQLNKWYKNNPEATQQEAFEEFKTENAKLKSYYKNILNGGTGEEIEQLYPLFISGSHNLTYEDMFVEKTLTLEHSFSQKSFVDYLDMIVVDFYEWLHEHQEQLDEMTEEEQLQLKIQIWKSFSDLLVAKNSAFGTIIRKTEKEILRAVKEGRPVIVDELNTIAMQNLIALNDILQRHAGSSAYITGVGPVTIQPGFAFIGTGNLSTQMVSYEGTNKLNPAFKSRFITIEYNYVSQNTTGSLTEQTDPMGNELFRLMLTHIADPSGAVELPAPDRTLEELFRLAQLSRVTQNVFMGKWHESGEEGSLGREAQLNESVLSIRNILHVLDSWNIGEEKDISKALWDGFVSSITDPDDQNFILAQAVRYGFFSAAEGWNVKPKALGDSITTYEEIRTRPYEYLRPASGTKSTLDLVHLVFGEGTQRKVLPREIQKQFDLPEQKEPNISPEIYQKLNERLLKAERSGEILDQLSIEGDK